MAKVIVANVGTIPFANPGQSDDWDAMAENPIGARQRIDVFRQRVGHYGTCYRAETIAAADAISWEIV